MDKDPAQLLRSTLSPSWRDRSPEDSDLPDESTLNRKLAVQIIRAIQRRTVRGVRKLRVIVEEGRIQLTGECRSFYCKQLAQHAAMGLMRGQELKNQIVVHASSAPK